MKILCFRLSPYKYFTNSKVRTPKKNNVKIFNQTFNSDFNGDVNLKVLTFIRFSGF